jgi:hypothetical protein
MYVNCDGNIKIVFFIYVIGYTVTFNAKILCKTITRQSGGKILDLIFFSYLSRKDSQAKLETPENRMNWEVLIDT